MDAAKHIFALEGEWKRSLAQQDSVHAALQFLHQVKGVQFVFRKVATSSDLEYYLDKATQKSYEKYKIIYLCFHGKPGKIYLHGKRNHVTLDWLADSFKASFKDKIVHFGSCSTLRLDEVELRKFKRVTGAACVSGYTTEVDFIDSTLMDIAYFDRLQFRQRVGTVDKTLEKHYPGMYNRLGFKMVK